jgi:hypothetical protein
MKMDPSGRLPISTASFDEGTTMKERAELSQGFILVKGS